MGSSNPSSGALPEEEDEEMANGDAAEADGSTSDGSGSPDPSAPPLFSEGEKVLAFHGPRIYEAKIQKAEVMSGKWKFFVHYLGWNKNLDEWVAANRLLKHTEENVRKQQGLAKESQPQENSKSRSSQKPSKTDVKPEKEDGSKGKKRKSAPPNEEKEKEKKPQESLRPIDPPSLQQYSAGIAKASIPRAVRQTPTGMSLEPGFLDLCETALRTSHISAHLFERVLDKQVGAAQELLLAKGRRDTLAAQVRALEGGDRGEGSEAATEALGLAADQVNLSFDQLSAEGRAQMQEFITRVTLTQSKLAEDARQAAARAAGAEDDQTLYKRTTEGLNKLYFHLRGRIALLEENLCEERSLLNEKSQELVQAQSLAKVAHQKAAKWEELYRLVSNEAASILEAKELVEQGRNSAKKALAEAIKAKEEAIKAKEEADKAREVSAQVAQGQLARLQRDLEAEKAKREVAEAEVARLKEENSLLAPISEEEKRKIERDYLSAFLTSKAFLRAALYRTAGSMYNLTVSANHLRKFYPFTLTEFGVEPVAPLMPNFKGFGWDRNKDCLLDAEGNPVKKCPPMLGVEDKVAYPWPEHEVQWPEGVERLAPTPAPAP